uniref:USP domain-containing protein n=1 Tax=viral metagenome TaxID=1070528 RepID=A0A6C0E9X9_9ZZZZ
MTGKRKAKDLFEMDDTETQRKKITVRGLSGLRNIGNTCYMNSVLQCLMATTRLSFYLVEKKFKEQLKDGMIRMIEDQNKDELAKGDKVAVKKSKIKIKFKESITYHLYKLFSYMWHRNCIIKPNGLKKRIGELCDTFEGNSQNDSQELLGFLLDRLHEETKYDVDVVIKNIPVEIENFNKNRKKFEKKLKNAKNDDDRVQTIKKIIEYKHKNLKLYAMTKYYEYVQDYYKNNYSYVSNIFTGMYINYIMCKKCNNVHINFEPFNMMAISIPKNSSEKITLEECIKNEFKKEVLNDENKCFCEVCNDKTDAIQKTEVWNTSDYLIIHLKRFKNTGKRVSKIDTPVEYPLKGLQIKNLKKNNTTSFSLYGIVHHRGVLSGGHYIAYTKNALNGKWYEFNDDDIVHCPNETDIVDGGAYILFYKKE